MLSRLSRPSWAALAVILAALLIIVLALAWNASRTAAPAPAGTATGPAAADSSTPPPAELPTAVPSATGTPVEFTATPSGPTAAPTPWARVSANAEGLRLRQAPGTATDVVRQLPAGTPLTVVGRTADNAWLQVITPQGEKGWVAAGYLDLFATVSQLPVSGTSINPTAIPYISGITAHARQVFLAGQAMGNHDYAFSLVGDSNTDNPAFLAPFDQGGYDLGPYADLQPTIGYFKGSFSRHSPAAVGGFSTAKVLDPANADSRCSAGETPLACEYRLQKPSVALILLGTGDQHDWRNFEARYRKIIEYTLAQGIVPVLMTKVDDLESKEDTAPAGFTNGVIVRLSQEYDVPLLDLRQAEWPLPNHGCKPDGFHYNSPPDGQTANFTGDHLNYGFNVRNLTALQVLDALRRYVLY
jgi:hypothetical protein